LTRPALDDSLARVKQASSRLGRQVRFMEVCGTHTHAIARAGLKKLIQDEIHLVSGPGCPVCVTSQGDIERMLSLARIPGLVVTTFGDMIRVPGVDSSLQEERAGGADVRIVYSPRDALELAQEDPSSQVVFLAVGFETTAPAIAATALQAVETNVQNLSFYVSHKLIVPAMRAVLEGGAALEGFLTPGHVSVILGADAYSPVVAEYGIPCVATGFEPPDIMEGLAMLTEAVADGKNESAIQYTRAVTPEGNVRARDVMFRAFRECDADWRGIGVIPGSGLCLRDEFESLDAVKRFSLPDPPEVELKGCRCGEVLKGLIDPSECTLFGKACTPASPVGPCMVSSEGSCAARYRYG
jgi:hydrogenase expression/formation protein HypD